MTMCGPSDEQIMDLALNGGFIDCANDLPDDYHERVEEMQRIFCRFYRKVEARFARERDVAYIGPYDNIKAELIVKAVNAHREPIDNTVREVQSQMEFEARAQDYGLNILHSDGVYTNSYTRLAIHFWKAGRESWVNGK